MNEPTTIERTSGAAVRSMPWLDAVERKWAHDNQQDQEWARAAESINDLRQMEYFLGRRSARGDCERDIKEAQASNGRR